MTHSTPIDSHWVAQSTPLEASLVDIYGVTTYVIMWAIHNKMWAFLGFSASALAGVVAWRVGAISGIFGKGSRSNLSF